MRFCACGSEQLDAVATLYAEVVEDLLAGINYPQWSHQYPNREAVSAAIAAGEQFAAFGGGRLLGAVMLGRGPQEGYESGGWARIEDDYLTVHALAVSPAAQGRGIGGFLVDGCIETARKAGVGAVRLDIVPENLPARQLYERKGFRYAGQVALDRGLENVPLWDLFEYNL